MGKTLYDKLWDAHVIHVEEDGTTLLYIDRRALADRDLYCPRASNVST